MVAEFAQSSSRRAQFRSRLDQFIHEVVIDFDREFL
jgi:hypothetical protein